MWALSYSIGVSLSFFSSSSVRFAYDWRCHHWLKLISYLRWAFDVEWDSALVFFTFNDLENWGSRKCQKKEKNGLWAYLYKKKSALKSFWISEFSMKYSLKRKRERWRREIENQVKKKNKYEKRIEKKTMCRVFSNFTRNSFLW